MAFSSGKHVREMTGNYTGNDNNIFNVFNTSHGVLLPGKFSAWFDNWEYPV